MNIRKIISLFISVCLFISIIGNEAVYSVYIPQVEIPQNKQTTDMFLLPMSYGRITETCFSGTDRVVINIQDLHCHPNVQKNISNIIELLDKKYHINNIYLEGAYNNIDISWLIKIKNLLGSSTLERILNTGRITGAEYYCALNDKNETIKGLENKAEYLNNLQRFGKILENQDKISVILNSVSDTTNVLKEKYYNSRQLKIEKLSKDYFDGKITAEKYFYLISKHTEKLNIDISKYENTVKYINLLALQKNLDYPVIIKQLKIFVNDLKNKIPAETYLALAKFSDNFSKIDNLHVYLNEILKEYKIDLSNYNELNKYFDYLNLSGTINPLNIIEENKLLANEINSKFANTKVQMEISFLVNFEKYLKDFLNAKITEKNYGYFKQNIQRYRLLWSKYVDNKVLDMLEEYIELTETFYNINETRNFYFTENIFNETPVEKEQIEKTNDEVNNIFDNLKYAKKIDIVVTGGFHTETLSDILKDKNISYIVITPRIKEGVDSAEETYYKLIKEQSRIQTQAFAEIVNSVSENSLELKIKTMLAAGLSYNSIKNIFPEITDEKIDKVKNNDIDINEITTDKNFSKLVKIAELIESDVPSNSIEALKDFLYIYIDDEKLKDEIDSDLIFNYLDLEKIKDDVSDTENIVKQAVEKRKFSNVSKTIKIYRVFIDLLKFFPINILSDKIINKLNEQINKNEIKKIWEQNYSHLGTINKIEFLSGGFQTKNPAQIKVNKNGVPYKYVLKPIARNYIDLKRNPYVIAEGINFAENNNIPTTKLYRTNIGNNFVEKGNYYYMLNDFAYGKVLSEDEITDTYISNISKSLADTHNKFREEKQNEMNSGVFQEWDIDKDINPFLFDFTEKDIDDKLKEIGIFKFVQSFNYEDKKYILYLNHLWKDEDLLKDFVDSEDERTVEFLIEQAKKLRQMWNSIDKNELEKLFIHGDWNMENIFFDQNGNVTSLIDWEQYGKAYRIIDFYRFFVDTRHANLFEINTILNFLFDYQENTDNPLNSEELKALMALMRFGFVSRAKYIINQNNKNEFLYNVKHFDEFFEKNDINEILKLSREGLNSVLNKIINYPKKDMSTVNRLKKSINNNEPISISFVCLLNKHRSASAHLMFDYYLKKAGKDKIQINSFGIIPLVRFAAWFFAFTKNISGLFGINYNENIETEVEKFIMEKDSDFNNAIFTTVKNNFKSENIANKYAKSDYIIATSKIQKMLLQILLGRSANIILFSDISIAMPDDSNLADPGRSHISIRQMLQLMYTSVKYLTSGEKDTGYKEYEEILNSRYEKSLDGFLEKSIFFIYLAIDILRSIIAKIRNVSVFLINSNADIIEPNDLILTDNDFFIENEEFIESLKNKNYKIATASVVMGKKNVNLKNYKKTNIKINYNGAAFRIYVKYDANNQMEDVMFYSKTEIEDVDIKILTEKLQKLKKDGITSMFLSNINNFIYVNAKSEADIINRIKVEITHNSSIQAIETVLNISDKKKINIDSVIADAVSNGIGVIVLNEEQLGNNKIKVESAKIKYGLKFVSSSYYDGKIMFDGNRINATKLNYEQAQKLLEEISKSNGIQVYTRMSMKLSDDVLSIFEKNKIDIFQKYGVIPIVNIKNRKTYSGRFELEITREDTDNIADDLLKEPNLISISVDDVSLLYTNNGTDGIREKTKEVNNVKKYYTKGLNSVLNSDFTEDYSLLNNGKISKELFDGDNGFLKQIIGEDFTENENFELIRNLIDSDFFKYNLSEVAKEYLKDIIADGNYTQAAGAVRGILMNTIEKQLIEKINKNNELNISVKDFNDKISLEYRIPYLTLALDLIIRGENLSEVIYESDEMFLKKEEEIRTDVNNIIREIFRENNFAIKPSSKTIEDYAKIEDVITDMLRDINVSPEIEYSIQTLKKVLAAA